MNSDTGKYNYPGCLGEQFAQRTTSLAAAEMGEEDNYNQIDGVPNNTTKPSILERLREYEEKKAAHIAETVEKSGKSPDRER